MVLSVMAFFASLLRPEFTKIKALKADDLLISGSTNDSNC